MTIIRFFTITLVLIVSLAASAQASVISITSGIGTDAAVLEQSWLGGAANYYSDSFENYAPNSVDTGSGIAMAFGSISGFGHVGGPGTTMSGYGEHATDGVNYWSNAAPGSTSQKGDFTLNFNSGLNSVGFYSTDFHDVGGQVNVTLNSVSGSETVNLFDYTGKLSSGTEVYWLIRSDEALDSMVFHQAGNDGYAIDGVTAATPIPGAAWLLGSGLLGLLGLQRIRRS